MDIVIARDKFFNCQSAAENTGKLLAICDCFGFSALSGRFRNLFRPIAELSGMDRIHDKHGCVCDYQHYFCENIRLFLHQKLSLPLMPHNAQKPQLTLQRKFAEINQIFLLQLGIFLQKIFFQFVFIVLTFGNFGKDHFH